MEREIVMKTMRNGDASFSSYLRPDNKATTITTAATLEDATTELSIFDARKYFNDDDSNNNNNNANNIQKVSISRVSPMERIPERGDVIITEATRYSSASSSVDSYAHIRNYRAQSFHAATPTASSEASWNSQTGLLSHPPGAIPVSMQNPKSLQNPKFSKSIWLLRRKCPCTGKKSVRVKESTQESKSQISQQERDYEHHNNNNKKNNSNNNVRNHITPNNWILNQTPAPIPALAPATATIVAAKSQRFNNSNSHRVVSSVRVPFTDGFTFPVLNPNNSISKLKLANVNSVVEEDPPRESLEVFRPPDELSPNPSPKQLNFPFPAKARVVVEDDAASDASSDLFEIESFSTATQSTYPAAYRRNSRDSFDEASAPASASASTSTTATATGFFYGRRSMDEGSTTPTITECYEPSEASIEWSVTTAEGHEDAVGNGVVVEEKWKRKGGNGLLVSCRSEKAVSVGPQPVKCGSEGQRNATSSSSSLSSHVKVIGSVNKPPLAHARGHRNAPRVSLAFAT